MGNGEEEVFGGRRQGALSKSSSVIPAARRRLTSVEARLHEHPDGSNTQLEVVGRDVGGVAHDEGQRLHALDERLGVVLPVVLAQRQAVLVHQRVVQLGFGDLGVGGVAAVQTHFTDVVRRQLAVRLGA
ncbi:hypothetical protein EYF80_034352 [Liparis tanakae]|uniref:Uncharacterized protein n=1 Tax=Liparis tanakae TaxID=230148 RepID=A0A4Z2GRR1_9TELE|nr:hypothetical protein EYF80_034352 [Liparis tanakae]